MANKTVKTRIVNKHDTEANWQKAVNFIPKKGEIIIYDKDSTHDCPRFKVGDGTTLVSNLPFTTDTLGPTIFESDEYTSGEENDLVKFRFKTGENQYGTVLFGKEGSNSGAMIGLEQVEGTRRLNFRSSSTEGAIVWDQPEADSQLYLDVDTVNFRKAGYIANAASFSPATNGTKDLGASSYKFRNIYGTALYENGTALTSKYASKSHDHTFTGTLGTISVSGTYSRATGITINPVTPSGTVTLSRSANVALSTTSIRQITGAGTLPTRESKTVVTSAINGASATFTGTVNAGSNTTSTGGTEYLEDATITGGGVTPTISYMHFSAGSAPTKAAVNVVTGVSGGGGSRTLSYLHYTAPSATKGSYTPAGSVTVSLTNGTAPSLSSLTATTTGAIQYVRDTSVNAITTTTTNAVTGINGGSGSFLLTVTTSGTANTASYRRILKLNHTHTAASSKGTATVVTGVSGGTINKTLSYLKFSAGTTPKASATGTFTGTATTALVTSVTGGSLTANTTSTNGIQVVQNATFTNASATTSTISQITGVGTNPSLTFNSTSSGGQAYVTNVTHTSPSLSKTTKYLHPTVSGSVSITTTTAPTTTVSSITGVGTLPTVSSVTVATGVSTQPNFTVTFSGTAVTPTGNITTSNTTINSTGNFTPAGTID